MLIGYVNRDGHLLDWQVCIKERRIFSSAMEKGIETERGSGAPISTRIVGEGGVLLLREKEKLIEVENINPSVYYTGKKWRSGGVPLFSSGIGRLCRTNQRLVFLRSPSGMREFFTSKGSITDKPVEMWKARYFRKMGMKEFFEIPLNEVIGYKKSLGVGHILCLLAENKKYALIIAPKNSKIVLSLVKQLKKVK